MPNVYPETIQKVDEAVLVDTSNEMTESLQNKVVENTAYQGYMWVPCLNKATYDSGPPYYYPIILPVGVTLEIQGLYYSTLSGMTGKLLTADGEDVDGFISLHNDYLKQDDNYTIKTSSKNMIFSLSGAYPFTLFYRIKGS